MNKLPQKFEEFKYLPVLIELAYSFVIKRYMNVSKESLIKILGALMYVVLPIDVISDKIPLIGYLDDQYVVGLCLNAVGEELQKFIEWKESMK